MLYKRIVLHEVYPSYGCSRIRMELGLKYVRGAMDSKTVNLFRAEELYESGAIFPSPCFFLLSRGSVPDFIYLLLESDQPTHRGRKITDFAVLIARKFLSFRLLGFICNEVYYEKYVSRVSLIRRIRWKLRVECSPSPVGFTPRTRIQVYPRKMEHRQVDRLRC